MSDDKAIIITTHDDQLDDVIENWAIAKTDQSTPRRLDLQRDKTRAVSDFFNYVRKRPFDVTPIDVKAWQQHLESKGLSHSTVYAKISRLSSFYRWLAELPQFRGRVVNPVEAARPKPPRAYQGENVQALDTSAVRRLLTTVKAKADSGDLVGKRDYAMLLFYFLTGRRRSEIARLTWGDLEMSSGGRVIVRYRVKGGKRERRELNSAAPIDALMDYLKASGRFRTLEADTPLWTSHDPHNQNPGGPLTSRAFVKNLKRYARLAGIGDIHLHQTRHTAAMIIAEQEGIKAAQELLGHSKEETTRVYVKRITVQKDRFSNALGEAFGLDEEQK